MTGLIFDSAHTEPAFSFDMGILQNRYNQNGAIRMNIALLQQ